MDQVINAFRVDFFALSASHHERGLIPLSRNVIIPDRLMQMTLVRKSRNAKNEW